MQDKKNIFRINLHKASAKLNINSFMIGGLFFVLTMMWSINPERFNSAITGQLLLAIPLLFVSSLAYTKVSFDQDSKKWDTFGWFTNTIGNSFIFNVLGLMAATINGRTTASLFFIFVIVLMGIYTIINISEDEKIFGQRLFKFSFMVFCIILGGVLPLFIINFK